VQRAWIGHPHLRVVDNTGDFDHKIKRVCETICRVVESPAPKEIERKFLLKSAPQTLPVHSKAFEIEQTYLLHQGEGVSRVRRRSSQGNSVYTHTTKRPLGPGQREEIERQITGLEYLGFLEQADPGRQSIRKQRTCFLWEQQYFELDLFRSPAEGLALLEIELDDIDQPITLPPFLEIDHEVTDDPAYLNSELARTEP
jgi:CYTH domain-containing protein